MSSHKLAFDIEINELLNDISVNGKTNKYAEPSITGMIKVGDEVTANDFMNYMHTYYNNSDEYRYLILSTLWYYCSKKEIELNNVRSIKFQIMKAMPDFSTSGHYYDAKDNVISITLVKEDLSKRYSLNLYYQQNCIISKFGIDQNIVFIFTIFL